MKRHITVALFAALAVIVTGCSSLFTPARQASVEKMLAAGLDVATSALDDYYARKDAEAAAKTNTPPAVVTPDIPPVTPPTEVAAQDEINLSGVTFESGPNISSWPITSTLSVSIKDRHYDLRYDKVKVWPGNSDGLNANPWIIAQIGGQWRAGNWEWMRYGQTNKDMSGDKTFGGHIKRPAWPTDWNPKSGETIYLAVSGLSRGGQKNVSERTPFVKVVVP